MSDTSAGLSSVTNALTKKLGPLPGYVWALIVVAAAYIVVLVRKRNAANQASTLVAPNSDLPENTAFPAPSKGTGIVSSENGNVPTNTNAQWARTVVTGFTAENRYSNTALNNAISDYLNGEPLDTTAQAIIALAIQRYGVPPEGVLPVKVKPVVIPPVQLPTPPPLPPPAIKPAPAPAPPPERFYTVRRGDNLSTIARGYYGWDNWQAIYNRNRQLIADPNLIYAGQVFAIPN